MIHVAIALSIIMSMALGIAIGMTLERATRKSKDRDKRIRALLDGRDEYKQRQNNK